LAFITHHQTANGPQGYDVNAARSGGSSWLRLAGLLVASVALAVAADSWLPLSGTRWESRIWLPAASVGAFLVLAALWHMLTAHAAPGSKTSTRRMPRNPQAQLRELQRSGGFWAVKLQLPEQGACEQALELRNRTFDLHRAPQLPLPGCTNKRCKCGYAGVRERRRRDVLPSGLSKDRRKGSALRWPGRPPQR
jgi:hypothetical protein